MQSVKSRLWETIRQINWFFQTNRCKEKKIGNRANKKRRIHQVQCLVLDIEKIRKLEYSLDFL